MAAVSVDVGDVITAAGGLVLGVLAWYSTQRGKKTAREEAQVADQIEAREQRNAERNDEFGRLTQENIRMNAQLERDREEHERREQETRRWFTERETQHQQDLAEERAARAAERAMYLDEVQRTREDYAALAATVRGQADEEASGEGRQIVRARLVSDSDPPAGA